VISLAGVAAGMRFFPRYYFLLLPVVVMMAARGFTLLKSRARFAVCLLLLIPVVRFAPAYLAAARGGDWRDTAMDRDSRAAAALVRAMAKPGDTLFVWGYRPEDYVYTCLPAATRFLDAQPLTGVPADRHLTQSTPVETEAPRERRAKLARSAHTFILDAPHHRQLSRSARLVGKLPRGWADGRDGDLPERGCGRIGGSAVNSRSDRDQFTAPYAAV
jgi:hypothetical protein